MLYSPDSAKVKYAKGICLKRAGGDPDRTGRNLHCYNILNSRATNTTTSKTSLLHSRLLRIELLSSSFSPSSSQDGFSFSLIATAISVVHREPRGLVVIPMQTTILTMDATHLNVTFGEELIPHSLRTIPKRPVEGEK